MSAPKSIKFKGQVYRIADMPGEVPTEMIGEHRDVSEDALTSMTDVKRLVEYIKGSRIRDEGLPALDMWLRHLTEELFPRGRHSSADRSVVLKISKLAETLEQARALVNAATLQAKSLVHELGRGALPYDASARQADVYESSKGIKDFNKHDLLEAFPDLDAHRAYDLEVLAKKPGRPDTILNAFNQALEAFGIEAIQNPLFYDEEPIALYVNTGDAYNATVVYDVEEKTFYLTTYGDWLEVWEREHQQEPV